LNPDAFFITDVSRDFTVVAVSAESSAVLNKEGRSCLSLAKSLVPTKGAPIHCCGFPNGMVFILIVTIICYCFDHFMIMIIINTVFF
jgi:hypothetical protein